MAFRVKKTGKTGYYDGEGDGWGQKEKKDSKKRLKETRTEGPGES